MAEKVKATKAATTPAKPRKPAAKKATAAPANVTPIDAPRTPAAAEAPRTVAVTRDQIAALAHQLWQERGRHHGSHEQDWLRAEQMLRGKAS